MNNKGLTKQGVERIIIRTSSMSCDNTTYQIGRPSNSSNNDSLPGLLHPETAQCPQGSLHPTGCGK